MLSEEQRKKLIAIARHSIESALAGKRPELDRDELDADLLRPSGAFVTLTERGGELRGCIGSIEAVVPLYLAVSSSATNAAFRDPRFFPVTAAEYPDLHLEISVMGPVERVTSIEDIQVGRDGLIISRGRAAGLLLPQVATDYGWDRETFLEHTCMKAGLPADAWRSPETKIEKFSAEVFGEK